MILNDNYTLSNGITIPKLGFVWCPADNHGNSLSKYPSALLASVVVATDRKSVV